VVIDKNGKEKKVKVLLIKARVDNEMLIRLLCR